MMVASLVPTLVPLDVLATAPVKRTVPKSANATSEPLDSKSSTIHSAFWPPSADDEVMVLLTDLPVVRFSMTATPLVDEDDVTEKKMTSPAEMDREKS